MAEEEISLADIIRRRTHATFVGREERRSQFGRNLGLAVDDPRRMFVFNIHGNAGVGKTYLTQQLQREAEHRGTVCGYVDESSFDVPEVLAKLMGDLTRAGYPLKKLEKQLSTYQHHRHRLESDPMAPPGTFEFIAQTALRTVLQAAKAVPGGGVAAEIVDPAAAAEQAERLRSYLAKKLRRTDDLRLVLSPADVLTPVFVEDLASIGRHRSVALFFDTFERTGSFLDDWLLDLLDGRYGALPADLAITIAGQSPLNPNRWSAYRSIIADVPLTEFTAAEATELLEHTGVDDPQVRDVILELSGRLPLLVAMLAEGRPATPGEIGDRTGDAIERFLRWETDPERQEVALAAAFPRTVDEDTLAIVTSAADAKAQFSWLLHRPFVTATAGRCRYHDVVRAPMLRLRRTQSPARWRELHLKLAEYFLLQREGVRLGENESEWDHEDWQRYVLEESYHRLCADASASLRQALRGCALAYDRSSALGRRWTRMLSDAARDTGNDALRHWSQQLTALEEAEDSDLADVLTLFVDAAQLSPDDHQQALLRRAREYRSSDRLGLAIQDYTTVLLADPDAVEALTGRGEAYRLNDEFEAAITDFSRAVAIDEQDGWSFGSRGQAHEAAGRPEAALADLSRAIELQPELEWALVSRGRILAGLGRTPEALADFDRVLAIDPADGWTLVQRAALYAEAGEHDKAMADYDRAIAIDPESDWWHAERGGLLGKLGRYDDALADYARAIELNDQNDWTYCERGDLFVRLGSYDLALADYRRAIELDPEYTYALVQRGELQGKLGRYDLAMADYDRAVESAPDAGWVVAHRADGLLEQSCYTEAVEEFDRALALDPSYQWARMLRAWTFCVLGRYDEARSEYLRVAEQKPEDVYAAIGVIRATLFGGYDARHLVRLAKVAVTAAPEAVETHYYFGILLLRQGQPAAGRRSISTAVRLTRQDFHDQLDETDATDFGLSLAAAGEYELADRYLAGLSGTDPVFARLLVDELRLLQRLPGIDSHQITWLIERL